jgi:phosphoribosylaminoimidazole-succinocarboxamide synthase
MSETVLLSTSIEGLPKIAEGKVRDLYEVDKHTLLFVASDRISAYDVVMKNVRIIIDPGTILLTNSQGTPSKGSLLTLLSGHWFALLQSSTPSLRTHFVTLDLPPAVPSSQHVLLRNRSMQVRKLKVFPIEAIRLYHRFRLERMPEIWHHTWGSNTRGSARSASITPRRDLYPLHQS